MSVIWPRVREHVASCQEGDWGWRIIHAFNKLNDELIPAQTPIPPKDMVLETVSGSTILSSLHLTDIFYQILLRPQDVSLTSVRKPSGMLW